MPRSHSHRPLEILGLGVLALLLLGTSAQAATLGDQTECEAIGGTWAASTCTLSGNHEITVGEQLTVMPTVTLELAASAVLTVADGATLQILGTVRNDGQLTNRGDLRLGSIMAGDLRNAGRLENLDGVITIGVAGTREVGTLSSSGTLDNQGEIRIDRGALTNTGQLVSWGLLDVTGSLMNEGTAVLDSRGGARLVVHEFGRLVNGMNATLRNGSQDGRDATTLTNDGRILNEGLLSDGGLATLVNSATGRLDNVGVIDHRSGTLSNLGGTINNNGYSGFGAMGTIQNHATIENRGVTGLIANGNVLRNHVGATLDNHATMANGCVDFEGTLYCPPDLDVPGSLVNDGTLTNGGQLDNHGSVSTTGQLTNTGVLVNAGQLTNTGTVANLTTWDNTGVLDTAGGTFTNDGVLTADCAGTISGSITGIPPVSSCQLDDDLLLADDGTCAQLGGSWTEAQRWCRVDTLVVSGDLQVADGVILSVEELDLLGSLTTPGELEVLRRMHASGLAVLSIGADGVLYNSGDLLIDGWLINIGTLVNHPGATVEINTAFVDLGRLENAGELTLNPASSGSLTTSAIDNTGTITLDNFAALVGPTRNAGQVINRDTMWIGGTTSDGAVLAATFTNEGQLDNHGLIKNLGSLILEAGSTFAHYEGATMHNHGYYGIREESTFWSEANSWFVNVGEDAPGVLYEGLEGFVDVTGTVFQAMHLDNFGDWVSGATADVFNFIGLTYVNHGTYTNRGTLHNSMDGQHGRFENHGLLVNEVGGLIANGGGLLDNATTGVLRNQGTVQVDDGRLTNDGVVVGDPGSTLDGTVEGAPVRALATSSADCLDGGWQVVATGDGTVFPDEHTCAAQVAAAVVTPPAGLSRIAQLDHLHTVLADIEVDGRDDKRVENATAALARALDDRRWTDGDTLDPNRGHSVLDQIRKAVRELDRVDDGPRELDVVADLLVVFTRDLAEMAIADATAAGGDDQRVDRAVAHLADADAHQAAGDRADAVTDHRKAWQDAMHALRR